MKRRFFALRTISTIYKILGIFAFLGMIGAIALVLLDAGGFPTLQSKVPVIAAALLSGILGTIGLFAIAQLIDVLIALETNTRATTAMLQRMGRLMKERL